MFLTYSEDYSDLTNEIKSILETEGSELLKATGKTSDGFIAEFNKLMKMDDAELEGKFAEAASILYNFSNALSEQYAKGTISKAARLKFATEEEGGENQEGNEEAEIIRPTFWEKTKEKLPKSPSEVFKLGLRTYMPFGMADLVLSMLLSLTDSNAPKTYRVLVAAWTLYLLFPADFFIDFILVAGYIDEYLLLAGLIPILKLISKETYTSNKGKVTKWLRGSSEEEIDSVIEDVVEDAVKEEEDKEEELSEDEEEDEEIASLEKKLEELKRKKKQQKTRDELKRKREKEKTEDEVKVTSIEDDDIPYFPEEAPKKKKLKEEEAPDDSFDKDIEEIRQKIDRELAPEAPVKPEEDEEVKVTSTEEAEIPFLDETEQTSQDEELSEEEVDQELFINNIEAIEPCIKASRVLNTNPEAFNIMKNINLNISDYLSYIDQEEIDEEEKLNKLFKIFDLEYSNEIQPKNLIINFNKTKSIFEEAYYIDLDECSDEIKDIIKTLKEKYFELQKAASEILLEQARETYSESGDKKAPVSQPELEDDVPEVDLEDSEDEVTEDDQAQFEDSEEEEQEAPKPKKKLKKPEIKQTSDKKPKADKSKEEPSSEEDEVEIPFVEEEESSTQQTYKESPFSSANVIIQDTSEEEKEEDVLYDNLKKALTCSYVTNKSRKDQSKLEDRLLSLNKYYFEIKDIEDKEARAKSKDKDFLKKLLKAYSHGNRLPSKTTISKRYGELKELISCLEEKAPDTYKKFLGFIFEANKLLHFYHQTEVPQTSEKVDVPKESPQEQEVVQVNNIDEFINSCFGKFDPNKRDQRTYIKNFDTFSKETLEEFDRAIKDKQKNEEATYSALFNNGRFVNTLFKTLSTKFNYEAGEDLVYPYNDVINGKIILIKALINRCDKEELKDFKEDLLSRLEKVRSIYTALSLKHEDFKKKKKESAQTFSEEESEDDISEDYTEILMQQTPISSFTDYIIRTPVVNVDTNSIVNVDEKPVVNKDLSSETNKTFSESDEEDSDDTLKRYDEMSEPFRLIPRNCSRISQDTYQKLYNNFFAYEDYIKKIKDDTGFSEEEILNDEGGEVDHFSKSIRDQSRNLLYKCFTASTGKASKPTSFALKTFKGYIVKLESNCKTGAESAVSFYKELYKSLLESLGKIKD